MRLLVLGGTVFLGRHVVDAALAAGHDVTAFSRGRSGSPPPADVEWVRGDRDGGLGALGGRSWDAIVDTSGYVPRVVAQSAALEHGHYTFVSTGNVYADTSRPGLTEDAPLLDLPEDHGEEVPAHYGPLKAACERLLGDGALIVRSGLIAGAHDTTHRFTYWAERIAEGGQVLAPGPPSQPCQLIDARDTAEWIVRCADAGTRGAFNVTGEPTTLGPVLGGLPGDAELVWADEAWLLDQGVEVWHDLPLWLAPGANPELAGFLAADVSKAVAAGLTFRPLAETARWALSAPEPPATEFGTRTKPAGMSRSREAELLAEWRRSRAGR
jgi:2'-hydroxyisoflavone reductase